MFVGGVSMTKVGQVVETLTGSKPSASTVSRVFHTLENEYRAWKQRRLAERYAYAFADGTYFTVIYNGEGCKMPILAVVGISTTGERDVLAFTVGERENEQAWKDLFDDLKARGVKEIGLWVSDGNKAMLNAITHHIRDGSQTALCGSQDGQCAQLHSQQAAGTDQTRVEGLVLSAGSAVR